MTAASCSSRFFRSKDYNDLLAALEDINKELVVELNITKKEEEFRAYSMASKAFLTDYCFALRPLTQNSKRSKKTMVLKQLSSPRISKMAVRSSPRFRSENTSLNLE